MKAPWAESMFHLEVFALSSCCLPVSVRLEGFAPNIHMLSPNLCYKYNYRVRSIQLSGTWTLSAGFELKWGFPIIRGTILGGPIIRTIIYWGLYLGTLILGNHQVYLSDSWPCSFKASADLLS